MIGCLHAGPTSQQLKLCRGRSMQSAPPRFSLLPPFLCISSLSLRPHHQPTHSLHPPPYNPPVPQDSRRHATVPLHPLRTPSHSHTALPAIPQLTPSHRRMALPATYPLAPSHRYSAPPPHLSPHGPTACVPPKCLNVPPGHVSATKASLCRGSLHPPSTVPRVCVAV